MLSNPRCNHYPERGTCEQSFEIKWYYDRFDHRCRRFHYGGCDGNENRFDTLIECEQTCHFDPQIDEISSRRCFQSHDPGTCWGNFERWYFDSNLKRCVCSWWSGCGGNSNRFYSYPHCMQICGEHAVTSVDYNNAPEKSVPEDTVYESPMQRLSEPHQIPSPYLTKPAKQILARPRDTQPLGGGILYPSHVSTPQHPPIYDDPDLFKIHPVFKDDEIDDDDEEESNSNNNDGDIEEFETAAYRSHYMNPRSLEAQEWSAKTETRFFPNLGLRNRTFTKDFSKTKLFSPTSAPETTFAPDATPEPLFSSEPITTTPKPFLAPKPIETAPQSASESQTETDTGMLLNLRPPAEFQSKNKKRNIAETEIVETNFRTNRQSRRSSGSTPLKPTSNVEEYETEFQKHNSPTAKKQNYEKYDTPHAKVNSPQIPPQLGYAQAASRNPRTRYHEEAETQFLRHSYINPPFFPGYPILKTVNSDGHRVPQPVPQGLINQLIAQHLALRERLGQTQKVPVIQVPDKIPTMKHSVEIRETPFRRVSSVTQTPAETSRILTYAEKRRRWKEEMKKKLKKQKVPPRQIVRPIITGEKNKYYVTYSPYYRLYQVSRQAPKGLNFTDNHLTTTAPQTELAATTSAPIVVISPEPPLTATPSSAPTTTTPIPSTTTTTTTSIPKIVSLKVEPIQTHSSTKGNKMQIRVAAIKPTSEAKGKQLLYIDDEDDEWKVIEEEDYYVDENGQPIEKISTTVSSSSLAPTVITTTVDNGLTAIVFPVGHKTESLAATASSAIPMTLTTRKPFEKVTPGADYILPEAPLNNQDYTDFGHSEEDLFFWKPEFENRRTRVDPSQSATESFNEELPTDENENDNDAFEITVHNPNKKL